MQQSMRTRAQAPARPATLVVAVVCLALTSLLNLTTPLIPGPPPPVVVLSIVVGVSGLVAAIGLWALHRWAMITAIIALTLTVLSAAPGLLDHPNVGATVGAGVAVALAVLTIVLMMLPSARRSYI
jgi:hypothetical protein